jgi:predicted ABC-type transport system involved in lysophospholipase L1 biosynthesis ATPase subunit
MVLVTHDPGAASRAERVVRLDHGRIVETSPDGGKERAR